KAGCNEAELGVVIGNDGWRICPDPHGGGEGGAATVERGESRRSSCEAISDDCEGQCGPCAEASGSFCPAGDGESPCGSSHKAECCFAEQASCGNAYKGKAGTGDDSGSRAQRSRGTC